MPRNRHLLDQVLEEKNNLILPASSHDDDLVQLKID